MISGQLIKVSRVGQWWEDLFGSLGRICAGQIDMRILSVRGIDMSGMLAVEIDLHFHESLLIVTRCTWCVLGVSLEQT
jgi:hypothetical protein